MAGVGIKIVLSAGTKVLKIKKQPYRLFFYAGKEKSKRWFNDEVNAYNRSSMRKMYLLFYINHVYFISYF